MSKKVILFIIVVSCFAVFCSCGYNLQENIENNNSLSTSDTSIENSTDVSHIITTVTGNSNVNETSENDSSSANDTTETIETLSYIPMDEVDYTLEKIDLPFEKDYETTALGYFRMRYQEQSSLIAKPTGALNEEREEPLKEEERILPAYHPEQFSLLYKIPVSSVIGITTYINDPATPLEPQPFYDLLLRQSLSAQYLIMSYNETTGLYAVKAGDAVYLAVERTDEQGKKSYCLYFDDGTYFFQLWGKTNITLDEMMKVVVSMNRPTRSVKEGFGAEDLNYPGAELIELQYVPDYKTTVGKYRFAYNEPGGYAYLTEGAVGGQPENAPAVDGYSISRTDAGDLIYRNEKGGAFTYRADPAGKNVTICYENGMSFYLVKIMEYDAIVLYKTVDGVQKSLGLFFSDGEYDYALQTHGGEIGLEELRTAAESIKPGLTPVDKVESIFLFTKELSLTTENNPESCLFSVNELDGCYVFTLLNEYQKKTLTCGLFFYANAFKNSRETQSPLFEQTVDIPDCSGKICWQWTIEKEELSEGNYSVIAIDLTVPYRGPMHLAWFTFTYINDALVGQQ